MKADKTAVPFHETDLETGWEPVPGGVDGLDQKILSGALDEGNRTGVRTRLIRFLPGTVNPAVFEHEYWEEVYLIDGDLTVGEIRYAPPAYACRPPGTPHGPFSSERGCLFFEIQYFA